MFSIKAARCSVTGERRESERCQLCYASPCSRNFIRFLIKNLYSSETPSDDGCEKPKQRVRFLGFALVSDRNDTHAPIFSALLQRSRCFHSHLYNLVAFYALSGLTIVNTIYVIYEAARKIRTGWERARRLSPAGVGASRSILKLNRSHKKILRRCCFLKV